MKELVQKREELVAKQKQLAAIFAEAGPEIDLSKVTSLEGDTKAKAEEIKRRNDELAALGKEVEELAALEKTAADVKAMGERLNQPASTIVHGAASQQPPVQKGLGELFIESATFKQFQGSRGPTSVIEGVDVKTLLQTSAGWAPESLRQPGYVPSAQMQPTLLDLIPWGNTDQAAVIYMEETTFTNNAAERAEGANNAGEAALALTQQTSNVREIAVWLPVTREQMDDVSLVQSYVNNRLTLMLRRRLNTQLMSGNGVAPNLAGIIGMAGVQTQAKGADPTMDAIHKGITLVRVTGAAEPSAIAMHPNDWQDVKLTRTADGIYILGNPGDAGIDRLWGLPVISDPAVTENTAVVGDFANYCQIAQKQGIVFELSDSHAGLFIQRTLAILASIRIAFVVYRPAAFCQVTGI